LHSQHTNIEVIAFASYLHNSQEKNWAKAMG